MEKKYKSYVLILIMRRTIFVALLVSLVSISSVVLIIILSVCQLIYLIYIVIIRPFFEHKSNMIEIINEIYFILLLSSLAYLNTENKWTKVFTNIYIWMLGSNSIVTFSIVLIDLIRAIICKMRNRRGNALKIIHHPSPSLQVSPSMIEMFRPTNKTKITITALDEAEVNRNGRYIVEESKVVLEENLSNMCFERQNKHK